MKNAAFRSNRANRSLPAILAVGGSLATLPASALELGELTVQSRLGQPLRASIAYALAPTEQLSDYCVTMRPGPSVSGLPGIGAATVSVANGVILLTGRTPVREPMVSAHVVVNCPYSANLSREYMLFIDPLTPAYDQVGVTQQSVAQQSETVATPVAATPVAVTPVAAVEASAKPAVAERPVAPVRTPADISASTRYRVERGDSLGTIAARIQDRPVGLWAAVDIIFLANPDAFLDNDPNRLKAGSWLQIPDFNGSAALIAPAVPVVEASTPELAASSPSVTDYSDTAAAAAAYVPQPVVAEAGEPLAVNLDDLAEDSVVAGTEQPTAVILDAQLEGPVTTSTNPNVPTAIIQPVASANDGAASSSWIVWLAGSGIAVFLGLLLFGRRLRQGTDATPDAPVIDESLRRRASDLETGDTASVETYGVDYDLSDDSPTEENLALDANLLIGTGLEHVAGSSDEQDFGFAAVTEVDIELPFEPVAPADEQTDMLSPLRVDESSILDSEVMPDDDEYDMSVIIDATKIPTSEEITERDLKAVEITNDDDSFIAPSYTINKDVDYQVLERDYEEEMSATQALNKEIARAAAELAERMVSDDDKTEALPLATVTELDVTAQMPAQDEPVSDPDATGVNEEITVNIAGDDDTVEMSAESGKAG